MILPIMKIHSNNKIKIKNYNDKEFTTQEFTISTQKHHKQEHQHQHTLNLLEFQLEL